MTATRPATRLRRRASARDLPRGEWERMVRERPYTRPQQVAPPLHVLGRRRELQELRRLAEASPEPSDPNGDGQEHSDTAGR
jgi:hypothetical protein